MEEQLTMMVILPVVKVKVAAEGEEPYTIVGQFRELPQWQVVQRGL